MGDEGKKENKPVYYPVEVDGKGKKKILGLPQGEDPHDYEIEIVTGEALKQLGDRASKWVAIKKSREVLQDELDWEDQGGSLRSG